ncbi:hypothetical protein PGB34_21040 [Xenophilus arseniciresistens]|uniref:DUF3617 family protein n=1 Tax=Xenophilus arseniciresistens TaxID=1283306 RepID=A0AAE3T155_9BURK|nr:DUF3617 family protein [Xenophilus arseniciresistens]MDA7418864.1 hypothetical protein [Xenophilus arseniciresistens]
MSASARPLRLALSSLAPGLLAAALLVPAAQAGPSFPPRKPGLWEMQMGQVEGAKGPMVVMHCVDAATDKLMQDFGNQQPKMNRKACKEETRNEAGKMMVHRETCQEGATKVNTHVVISGNFDSHYSVQSTTTYEPPRPGRATQDMRMEATWKGPCTAGQKPGDMVMPGGMKMNVIELMKMAPAAAAAAGARAPAR